MDILKIIEKPYISEKASELAKQDKYIFTVYQSANKTEVKKAIEQLYKVNVIDVWIINAPSKKKRLGKIQGEQSAYKKAIVKIKKGQKIEILPR